MLKLLIVFLSLFSSNIFDYDNDYKVVSEIVTESRTILNKIGDITLLNIDEINLSFNVNSKNSTFIITDGVFEIKIEAEIVIMNVYDDELYLCVYEGAVLKIMKYDTSGNLMHQKLIYGGSLYKMVNLFKVDGKLYFFATAALKKKDVLILKISEDLVVEETKYLGGVLDDCLDFAIYQDNFYISVAKDPMSGGDFGYGHNSDSDEKKIVVAVIDKNLSVIKYETLDTNSNSNNNSNEITNDDCINYSLEMCNNILYLVTSESIWLFDTELNYLSNKRIDAFKALKIGLNGLIIVFREERVQLLDTVTLEEIKEIPLEENMEFTVLNSAIHAKGEKSYYIDVISFKDCYLSSDYIEEFESIDNVYSLFGKCTFVDKYYESYFSKEIYGEYPLEIEYETIYGIPFTMNFKYSVDLKCNVTDKMVYSTGFRLLFNGDGYLDGNKIANNYAVYEEGNHTLIIKGNGKETQVDFYCSSDQLEFEEKTSSKGVDILQNTPFDITFFASCLSEYEVVDINVKGLEKDKYVIFDDKVQIFFLPVEKTGPYSVLIENVVIKILGENVTKNIGLLYHFNVVGDKPSVNLLESINNTYSLNKNAINTYVFDTIDTSNLIRGIEVEFISDNENYFYYYPLGNIDLVVSSLPAGNYVALINALYSNGSNEYKEIPLLNIYLKTDDTSFTLGSITIKKYNKSLEKFDFTIPNKLINSNLIKVAHNEDVIFQKEENNILEKVIICSVSLVTSFAVSFAIRALIVKKKDKRFIDSDTK